MQPFTIVCAKIHTNLCKKVATINTSLEIDI